MPLKSESQCVASHEGVQHALNLRTAQTGQKSAERIFLRCWVTSLGFLFETLEALKPASHPYAPQAQSSAHPG